MSNFRFIERNIDVSNILQKLRDNPDDWNAVSLMQNTGGDKNPYGFLPITMAVVADGQIPQNAEGQKDTPFYTKYFEIVQWLRSRGIKTSSRAAFFRLRVGDEVGRHIDVGSYYKTRDRFHLSLQGRYLYEVGGEEHIIEPGTFFWFDNKKMHSAVNIGNVDRLTFVFDVPHSHNHPNNSRNFI